MAGTKLVIQIQGSRKIAGVLQLHIIPEASSAFLRSNLASHFRSNGMVTLGRERTKAHRRRKYILLDNIFLEVTKQLWSKSSHLCILFFLSLSSPSVSMPAYISTDLTFRTQQCSVFLLFSDSCCCYFLYRWTGLLATDNTLNSICDGDCCTKR